MTPEERQLLEGLFERIKTAAPADADREAEAFIGKSVKDIPHAGYVLSQAVIVQEEALKAAVAKIEELEASVEELQDKAEQAQKAGGSGFLGGFGKTLFGGNEPASERYRAEGRPSRSGSTSVPSTRAPESGITVPPRPGSATSGSAPWTHQRAAPGGPNGPNGAGGPGAAQGAAGGGNTFLKGALGAAAGVAGGMLLANAVGGLFSGGNNPLGIGGAKASESKSSEAKSNDESGDDWKDDNSGDDWSENSDDNSSDDAGDDWGDDSGDDDWGDGGGGDDW